MNNDYKEKCLTCISFFWKSNIQIGECRRYAPHPIVQTTNGGRGSHTTSNKTYWPVVKFDDFCKAHEPASPLIRKRRNEMVEKAQSATVES